MKLVAQCAHTEAQTIKIAFPLISYLMMSDRLQEPLTEDLPCFHTQVGNVVAEGPSPSVV